MATARVAARTVVVESLLGCQLPPGQEESTAFAAIDAIAGPEGAKRGVVVVHDQEPCVVAAAVLAGYQASFGDRAAVLPFRPETFFDDVQAAAAANAVIVLVQNHAFQNELRTYRVRMRLWDLGFRVAEHGHLSTINDAATFDGSTPFGTPADAAERYVDACALSPFECDAEAKRLAARLDACDTGVTVHTAGGHELQYGPLERCLLNTGSYYQGLGADDSSGGGKGETAKHRPVGGSYPFGEIITEAATLSSVTGDASIFAYPNLRRSLDILPNGQKPFVVRLERGAIVDVEQAAPQEFKDLVALVRDVEGDAVVRELGIGLNRRLAPTRPVADITAFERQFGVHFSVGKRHPLFVKAPRPGGKDAPLPEGSAAYDFLRRKDGKFHLDVFLAAERIADRTSGATVLDFRPPAAT